MLEFNVGRKELGLFFQLALWLDVWTLLGNDIPSQFEMGSLEFSIKAIPMQIKRQVGKKSFNNCVEIIVSHAHTARQTKNHLSKNRTEFHRY